MIDRRSEAWRFWLALCAVLVSSGSPWSPWSVSQASAQTADAAASSQSWYAATIARSESSFMLSHYWSKGRRMRAETVAGARRLITIVDETTYYVIDPTRAEGIAIERSSLAVSGDASRVRPFGDEVKALLRGGGERVGEEEIAGYPADHYQLTNSLGRVQVWVRKDLDLPVRVERYVRSSGVREQIDYINWQTDPPIADSFFEPPQGIEIQRVGYDEYIKRTMNERLGPAPPFYAHLLHGEPGSGGD